MKNILTKVDAAISGDIEMMTYFKKNDITTICIKLKSPKNNNYVMFLLGQLDDKVASFEMRCDNGVICVSFIE